MGLLSNYIAYRVGKRVGGRESPEPFAADPTCLHYAECASEGGCLGRSCEFGEISEECCD